MITSRNFTFTKRQIGLLMFIGGLVGVIALLALDAVGGGREGGIGPAQRLAIILMGVIAFVGLTLIPLGSDPA